MVDGCGGVQAGKPHDGVAQDSVHVTPVGQFCDRGVGNDGHLVNAQAAQ